MITWSTSTGSTGSTDTRALAAAEVTDSVLHHWSTQAGDGEHLTPAVTIHVDTDTAVVGPGHDTDDTFDHDGTRDVLASTCAHLTRPSGWSDDVGEPGESSDGEHRVADVLTGEIAATTH